MGWQSLICAVLGAARCSGVADSDGPGMWLLRFSNRGWRCSLALVIGACSLSATAAQRPLWEVGLGGGLLTLPDYRGSDRSQVYPYPFALPYVRGKVLKADERGIRGIFFESDRIKLDVSLDGSVPVSSSDNPARDGMSDLAPSFQVGPKFRFLLWKEISGKERALSFNLPVRAVFAVDSGLKQIGYTAHPNLSLRLGVPVGRQDWHWSLTGGPLWGSDRYHRYFYSVSPSEARQGRSAYDAQGGYSGIRVLSTFYHREPQWLVSLYAIYDSVQGAKFEDSPLVKQDQGITAGFLFAWFFFKSEEMVETSDWEW